MASTLSIIGLEGSTGKIRTATGTACGLLFDSGASAIANDNARVATATGAEPLMGEGVGVEVGSDVSVGSGDTVGSAAGV